MSKAGKKKVKAPVPPKKYLGNDSDELKETFIEGKGRGVKAAAKIPANARIAYKGVTIDQDEYDALVNRQIAADEDSVDKKLVEYIVASGESKKFIDGNPARPNNRFLSALINEPSAGQTANLILTHETFHSKRRPVLIAPRDIEPGEELTAKYGSGKDFKRGYKVGKQAPEPKWWKQRNQKQKF